MRWIVRLRRRVAGERNATVYLMISKYLALLERLDEARPDHARYLDGLEKAGYVVSAGRQDPPVGGVIIFDVDTADEARALIADDPYVQRGLAEYEPYGWVPTRGLLANWTRTRD
jgi:uncharacterized protein YciI